jgi:hypothetical protein
MSIALPRLLAAEEPQRVDDVQVIAGSGRDRVLSAG